MKRMLPLVAAAVLLIPMGARAGTATTFSSAHALLLRGRDLPAHYALLNSHTVYSVAEWDGNVKPVMAIDERSGWLEGAVETLRDPRKQQAQVSVQLFRGAGGARGDFGQFFTNAHPGTIYVPGQQWLGGSSVRGYGDRATIYRVDDSASRCPQHLTTGLSFLYANAIVSVGTCTIPSGEAAARELGKRLLRRAKS